MKEVRITILTILVFLSFLTGSNCLTEKYEWRTDPFHYVYFGKKELNKFVKEMLQCELYNAFSLSSTQGKVPFPSDVKIVIAETPEIFSMLTKMTRNTAGCYSIKDGCLVIQNPDLLLRRKILSSTLYHESLHWMLMERRLADQGERHKSQGDNQFSGNYYNDEFFTEALSPSSDNIKAGWEFFPADYNNFLRKIRDCFTSKKAASRSARDAARMWGAYILNVKGMDALINYVLGLECGLDPEKMYVSFLKKINKE